MQLSFFRILGANLFGQSTTIAIQIVSLPAFLASWDIETYGRWLVISSLPTYFSISDFGIVAAAANRMTIALGQDDVDEARRSFANACAIVLGITVLLLIGFTSASSLISSTAYNPVDAFYIALGLALWTALIIACALPNAVLQARLRTDQAVYLTGVTRISEAGAALGAALFTKDFVWVVYSVVASRLMMLAIATAISNFWNEGFAWNFRDLSRQDVLKMCAPAAGFFLLPLTAATSFQGVAVVIGTTLGPAATAIFSAHRTISRVLVQLTALIGNSLGQDMAVLFARAEIVQLNTLARRASKVVIAITVIASGLTFLLFRTVLETWGKGKIIYHSDLAQWLLIAGFLSSFGCIDRAILFSTNHHVRFAVFQLVVTGIGLAIFHLAPRQWGLSGAAVILAIIEGVVYLMSRYSAFRLAGFRILG